MLEVSRISEIFSKYAQRLMTVISSLVEYGGAKTSVLNFVSRVVKLSLKGRGRKGKRYVFINIHRVSLEFASGAAAP